MPTKRGTTYTHIETVRNVDLTKATEVVLTVKILGQPPMNWFAEDMSISSDGTDSTIAYKLTQEQSLSLREGYYDVDCNWMMNGTRCGVNIIRRQVTRTLYNGIMEGESDVPDPSMPEPDPAEMSGEEVRVLNAISPKITDIQHVDDQTVVTVKDIEGMYEIEIPDGQDGRTPQKGVDYDDGEDGYSPSATVTKSGKTATITITDKDGTTTENVSDGEDGDPGDPGFSPVVTVTDIEGGHRVTITDAEGDHVFDVMDGQGGSGSSDYSDLTNKPSINNVTLSGNKSLSDLGAAAASDIPTKVSDLSNDSGFLTTETDPTVPSWAKQSSKPTYTAQEVGALPANTSIPSKTSDLTNDSGFLTVETDPTVPAWAKATNKPSYTAQEVGALPDTTVIPTKVSDLTDDSGHYTKPASGIPASDLAAGIVTVTETISGSTPSIIAQANHRYICGECSTLTVTTPASGIVDIIFQSGSTPTVLTVTPPSGTMHWPDWFDPTSLEANRTYEINILDGVYGVVGVWS